MELADTLIEEGLRVTVPGADLQPDLAGARHQPGALPGSLIEGLAMEGMPGFDGIGWSGALQFVLRRKLLAGS